MLCKVFNVGIFCALVSISVEILKAGGTQKSSHDTIQHLLRHAAHPACGYSPGCSPSKLLYNACTKSFLASLKKKLNSPCLLEWESGDSVLQRNFSHVGVMV